MSNRERKKREEYIQTTTCHHVARSCLSLRSVIGWSFLNMIMYNTRLPQCPPNFHRGCILKLVEPDHLWEMVLHLALRVLIRNQIHLLENLSLALALLFWLIELGNQLVSSIMRVVTGSVGTRSDSILLFTGKTVVPRPRRPK